MAVAHIRRKEDDALLCDYLPVDDYDERWRGQRAIHFTSAGNTIPQKVSVMEYWFDIGMIFADDDPVSTLANYDTLMYDINNTKHFILVDEDGDRWPIYCVSDWPETTKTKIPEGREFTVKATYKLEGYLP